MGAERFGQPAPTPSRAARIVAGLALGLTPLTAQVDSRAGAAPPEIDVRVDPRVELLSVIFRLAGHPEYNRAQVPQYAADVDAHFGGFRDHPVVELARSLRRARGVSYDAVMSMAVHLDDAVAVQAAVPLSPLPPGLDRRWGEKGAAEFVALAREFVSTAEFAAFIDEHEGLYAQTAKRFRSVLADHARLEWFDRFFGTRPGARFEVALGMLNGGGNYGARLVHDDGKEDLYCVLGVWLTGDDGAPVFDESVLATVVHEFCHSYCNPLVHDNEDALEGPALRLWPHVEEAMRAQAYGTWQTMMCESMVRACVVRYVEFASGAAERRAEVERQLNRQFLWTGELSALLDEYERERDDYATVAEFMPRVVEFFDEYSGGFAARMAAAPKVEAMVPENGAGDVDPALAAIVITFDRPMQDESWAFVGGGETYPGVGKPSYDDRCRTVTLPVALEPGRHYEFWLNHGRFQSFRSAGGVPLAPVHVSFETARPR